MGAEETVAWYASEGGCATEPTTETLRADTTDDGTRVIERTWIGCSDIAAARFFKIEGGGHSWPGGEFSELPNACQDVSATDELIAFWSEYAGY